MKKLKKLEFRIVIEINENEVEVSDVIRHLDNEIDDIVDGVVKRVDLIDIYDD